MKILAIHNILWSHYKARIFAGLHAELMGKKIDFFVLQLAYSERSRMELATDLSIHNYPHEVLFPDKAIEDIGVYEKIKKLLASVIQYQPAIVYLNGYYDIAYWFIFAYCKLKGIRLVVDFESNEISRKRVWWKEQLKRFFLGQCDGLVCLGQKAAEYASKLGVKKEKILSTKNVGVDNDALLKIYNHEFQFRDARKKELGLPLRNLLYAGRFVKRKNLENLIRAFDEAQRVAKNGDDWGIILSGGGEEKKHLVGIVEELGNPSVHFMEPCEWYEVPIRYTLSDVAVLPSTFEPFGFLTNEAMVYSMPVLVSNRCGSAADLVIDDYNGYQFDPYDKTDFRDKIVMLMNKTQLYDEFGANGKIIIDQWAPDVIVNELVQAFLKVSVK